MGYFADCDSNGNITGYFSDEFQIPNYIPKTAIPITDEQYLDSRDNIGKYIIQNNSMVAAPPIPDATQFSNAQSARVTYIENAYAQTLAAGFQFTIGTSTYTMGWRQDAVYNDQLHLNMTQMAVDKGVETFPVPYADINGNPVSIPDQTTLTALDSKANAFSWNNLKQLRTTVANIRALTLSSYTTLQEGLNAINAITWTPAAY